MGTRDSIKPLCIFYFQLLLYLDRIFQELERNAQNKSANDEAVGQTGGSWEEAKENSDSVARSFSGKYNSKRHVRF